MKLIQLDVQSFGSFKNRQFHFPAGLTVFWGENEQGKSTLLACLKAMFYGFSGRSRSPLENERLRYQPWDGSRPGASLIFEQAGIRYRLQRSFGKTRAQDETLLMHDISGAKVDLPGQQEVGPFLFQVSAEEFTQTVFIGQMNSVIAQPDASILTKLTNLSSSFNETLSYQAMDSRLQKALAKLRSERGKAGLIVEMEQQLEALSLDRETALKSEKQRQQFTLQLQELNRQKAQLQDQMDVLSDQLVLQQVTSRRQRLERLAARHQEVLKLRQDESDKARHLADHGISEAGINTWQQEFTLLLQERQHLIQWIDDWRDKAKAALAAAAAQNWRTLADCQQIVQDLAAQIQSCDLIPPDGILHPQPKPAALWLVILNVILVAAGLLLGVLIRPAFFTLVLVAVIDWAFVFFWRKHADRVQGEHQKAFEQQQAQERDRQVKTLQIQLEKARTEASEAQNAAIKAQADLEAWDDAASRDVNLPEELIRQTDVFLDHWLHVQQSLALATPESARDRADGLPTSAQDLDAPTTARTALLMLDPAIIQQGLDRLTTLLAELNQIRALQRQAEAALASDLDGLSWEQFQSLQLAEIALLQQKIKHSERVCEIMEQGLLEQRLSEVSGQLAAIERELAGLESAILHSPRPAKLVTDYDRDREILNEQLEKARMYYESLTMARSWIQKAYDELQATFGPRLNQEAARILHHLTRSRYEALKIDRSFAIQVAVPEDQNFHDWRFFSGGTIDQVYLALRLAIAGIIQAGSEPLPLLLDDALVQYDDGRASAALDYLSRHSQETGGQVLLMTSQARIKAIAGQISPAISVLTV